MKICVSSYSFGEYVNKLGIKGVIDKAAELGFDAIEFVESGWTDSYGAETARIVGEYAREKGLYVANYCVGADFVNGSGGDINAEVKRLKAEVDFAAALGSPFMRHDIASFPQGKQYSIGYDDVISDIAPAIREVSAYAASKGVCTITENHGYFSQDADRVEKLINAIASPNFGYLLDTGNFMCADEDPTLSVGKMARYAKHIHVKDFHFRSGMEADPGRGWFVTRGGNYLRGAILGHGNAKAAQSVGIIKRSGYDGCISIEFEGIEDNLTGIAIGLENLKKFLA